MTWFMLIMLFLGLLAATPFVLRFIVFQIIYPLQARSMKGAWTKDPRFYAYAEHFEQQHNGGGEVSSSTSRFGHHRRRNGGGRGGGSRGGGRTPLHAKATDSDVPDLIPLD